MRLAAVRLRNVGPFGDATLGFTEVRDDAPQAPRPLTIVFGGDGTGKTTLLSALATTRPGHALPPLAPGRPLGVTPDQPSWVRTDWLLGDDDPERPHALVVTSPSAVLDGETPELAATRRREQAIFERRAQAEGGHVFVAFSGARWFSRSANMLTTPDRTLLRWDVRQAATFDDPTRADLTRETKQVLAYAAIARALGAGRAEHEQLARFEAAVRDAVDVVLEPFDVRYIGPSPTTLEPELRAERGRIVGFEGLPRPARHLVAFATLTTRALFAGYPGAEAPRESEGVVAIDDAEAQQDPALLRHLVPLLRSALPGVQWILTTSSSQLALACEPRDVLALRASREGVEVGEGLLH
jgi:hypothetical protein